MKKVLLFALIASVTLYTACKNDDDGGTTDFDYHIHIQEPITGDQTMNSIMALEIEFESHTEETIHHINIRMYNKADNTEIYNKPSDAHVHETGGLYTFTDNFELATANGITENTTYVLEAKVWGHEDGIQEEIQSIEFNVVP